MLECEPEDNRWIVFDRLLGQNSQYAVVMKDHDVRPAHVKSVWVYQTTRRIDCELDSLSSVHHNWNSAWQRFAQAIDMLGTLPMENHYHTFTIWKQTLHHLPELRDPIPSPDFSAFRSRIYGPGSVWSFVEKYVNPLNTENIRLLVDKIRLVYNHMLDCFYHPDTRQIKTFCKERQKDLQKLGT